MTAIAPRELPAMTDLSRLAQLWRTLADWRTIVLGALVLLLIYQVIIPFAMIIWTSLKTARPGEPAFMDFAFSLAN